MDDALHTASDDVRDPSSIEDATDAHLIRATREGVPDAFGELWRRHHLAAISVARSLAPHCAEDLAADAFARVLRALRSGAGPVDSFRPYLLAAVRSRFVDHYRVEQRSLACSEESVFDRATTSAENDDAWSGSPADQARLAWESLDTRDQWVCWATVVAGYSTPEVAEQLGVKRATAAVWVHRSRERLRVAYLSKQIEPARDPACQAHRQRFVGYLRGTLGERHQERLLQHLDACGECQVALTHTSRIDARMRVIAWPAIVASGFLTPRLSWWNGLRMGLGRLALQTSTVKATAVVASVAVATAGTAGIASVTASGSGHEVAIAPPIVRHALAPSAIATAALPIPRRTQPTVKVATAPQPAAGTARPTPPVTSTPTPTAASPTATTSPSVTAASPPATTSAVPSSSASATPAVTWPTTTSGSATFSVPVADPQNISGSVVVTLPTGWSATGVTVGGLTTLTGVTTSIDGSNQITITLTNAVAPQAQFTIAVSGSGPDNAPTATAQEAIGDAPVVTATQPITHPTQ